MSWIFSFLFIIVMASPSVATETKGSPERDSAIGYLKLDGKGRTFFVQNPNVLEPGVPVTFASPQAEKIACKLTQTKPPLECPPQTISFEIKRKFRERAMVNARVEDTSGPWHQLRAKELMFEVEVSSQPSKTK